MKKISLLFLLTVVLWGQEKSPSKFSGYVFGDYFYNVSRDTSFASLTNAAAGGAKDFNGFQLRRIYLTYDNEISSTFSSRVRLEGTTGAPFIKDAYVKWKEVFSGSDLVFGIQPTPAFEVSESYWGFRSVEKSILDLRGVVSSRDLGVSLKGKLDPDGTMNYWVLFGNGSGTNAETDKYKRIYTHIDLKPTDKFRATVYADYKMLAHINDPVSTTTPKKTLNNNVLSTALFLGYGEKGSYSIGAEGFYQIFSNGYVHGTAPVSIEDKNALGMSLFGSYFLNAELSIFGRYDYYEPNMASSAKYDVRNYLIAGASWAVDKNVSIIPNIQVETYENVPAGTGTRSVDPAVTGRVTLHYIFL
jgi:hypothetical protein